MIRRTFAAGVAAVVVMAVVPRLAVARDYRVGDVTIAGPYALPTPPGAKTGAAYLPKLANGGPKPDALVGATSPLADRVEIHTMKMDGDVMRMRDVASIPLAPSASIAMTPGLGYHLMLVGIHAPFVVGREIPITLRFERAGSIDVVATVQERASEPMVHHMEH